MHILRDKLDRATIFFLIAFTYYRQRLIVIMYLAPEIENIASKNNQTRNYNPALPSQVSLILLFSHSIFTNNSFTMNKLLIRLVKQFVTQWAHRGQTTLYRRHRRWYNIVSTLFDHDMTAGLVIWLSNCHDGRLHVWI